MKINLNNYEVYFIDHFDGILSDDDERELVLFLENNSDLKEEFDGFSNFNLEDEEIVFENKSTLKKTEIVSFKSIHEENYESRFIAYFEGDLNKKIKNEVEEFVKQNPSLKPEFDLHKKLFLPKEEILFADKKKLKKKALILSWQFRTSVAAAASIALLISMFWLLLDTPTISNRNIPVLSMTQSKQITFTNIVSLEIENRVMAIPELYVDSDVTLLDKNSDEISNNEANRITSITYLSRHGKDIAITGQIECAKLVQRNSGSSIYFASAKKEKRESLFGKVVNTNANLFAQFVLPNRNKRSNTKNQDPIFVKLMQGSITVFNTITGSEVEDLKVYDSNGNLKNYQVETQMLTMNKKFPPHGVE